MCAPARGEEGRCARPPSVTVWPSAAGARPGLGKVGRGAWGAAGDGGAVDGDGACTPLGGDESCRAPSMGANPVGGGGSATPSPRPNRTGTGPAGGIPGGRGGLGTGALGPRSREFLGRRGGDRPRLRAAAGEGGCGSAGLARGRTPRGPRWQGEGSRERPFPVCGGGLLPARWTMGAPQEGGGRQRAWRRV